MSFDKFLQLLSEATSVRAGEVNKPLRQLDGNTRYIWEVLQAASIGSTIYARRQTLDAEVKVGMPVYFDTTTQKYRKALALAEIDATTGAVTTAASSHVWGIVATKINATLGDILLYGVAEIDISEATTETPTAGLYYLSGTTSGKLTMQRPPVSVPVLRRVSDGNVFVTPQFVDFIDRHVHYQFDLVCEPAGTTSQPTEGGLHTIADANSVLRGWLPADHVVFAGKAPAGAVFGYNLQAHPALANAWPPLPATNADLQWNKGTDANVGFTGVPLGTGGLCVLDNNGIWWMSNCYGDVPWPLDYDSTVSTSYSDSVGAECPRHLVMAMRLAFTKVSFATDSAVVLSLRSNDARIKINCYGDTSKTATTGHLQIALDLNLVVADDATGSYALKNFDPVTGTFTRGPVTEGLYALSSNVNLTGTTATVREVDSVSRVVHQGLVGVAVDPADTKELDIQLVRLSGAEEAFFDTESVMYLEFVAGDVREYRAKINIPNDLAIPTPQMRLRFWVLGRAAGTLPQLTFSACVVTRPLDGLDAPVDLTPTEDTLVCDTTGTLTAGDQYVEAETELFAVEAGATVFFTVRREASDGYAAAVGILRQVGVIESGS